jgi:ATP-dependent helicase IRC3
MLYRLCDMRFTSVKTNLNLKEVTLNAQTGDFNPTSLAEQMNQRPINELVVKSWIDRAGKSFLWTCLYILTESMMLADRRSSLIFCVDIAHVLALTETFRQHGIDARSVDSHTNPNERKLLISQFRQGVFPVLVNCGWWKCHLLVAITFLTPEISRVD